MRTGPVSTKSLLALMGVAASLPFAARAEVEIATVAVADLGNTPASIQLFGKPFFAGGVNHGYRIGAYEVTNEQYSAFLNAKARGDALPASLYSLEMTSDPRGGIVRTGVAGAYQYAPKPNMADKPVNFVDFFDACRFANWLHNGQGNGDTETGAYTLGNRAAYPSNAATLQRNPGATWFVPSADEWFKAAFYDPRSAVEGGPTSRSNYWLYPTASDVAPTHATTGADGRINNPGDNVANFGSSADWGGQDGNLTSVGSAGTESVSYYGTFDQAGNVWEWNEMFDTPYLDPNSSPAADRGLLGGYFGGPADYMLGDRLIFGSNGSIESAGVGFRVATVPEPSTLALFSMAACAAMRRLRSPE